MNDYLAHYGVIGMKWGVRKSRGGYSQSTKSSGRRKRGQSSTAASKLKQVSKTAKNAVSSAVKYTKANPHKIIGIGVGAVTFAALSTSPALAAGVSAYNASQLFLKNTKISDLYTNTETQETNDREAGKH